MDAAQLTRPSGHPYDDPDSLGVVLVCLERPAFRQALGQSLARLGWQVIEASSPEAATGHPFVDALIVSAADPWDPIQLLETFRVHSPLTARVLVEVSSEAPREQLLEILSRAAPNRSLLGPLDAALVHTALEGDLRHLPRSLADRRALAILRERNRLRSIVDAENPDLASRLPSAPYAIKPSAQLVAWLGLAPASEARLIDSARIVLDDVLAYVARRPRASVVLELQATGWLVSACSDQRSQALAHLSDATATALVQRLFRLCGVVPDGSPGQCGELLVDDGGRHARVLVRFQRSGLGWRIEAERLLDWREVDEQALATTSRAREYRFLLVLTEDATSVTYRALDVTLERHVSIKVLRRPASEDPDSALRLLRQARAEARAASPGILQMVDYGQLPDGRPFVAHELVEWISLQEKLAEGPIEAALALRILERVLGTLVIAHEADIVHRGLSPACIWLGEEGEVKVGDFGVARLLFDRGPKVTVASQVFGDPRYVAPEQLGTKQVDGRVDVYSLGCIAWQMVSGHAPFEDGDRFEILAAHRACPPRLEDQHARTIPAPVRNLLLGWLAKESEARPTAAVARDQVQGLLAGR